ncbi:putative Ig heavy chain variable region, VH3 family [Listeria marthii FSL S4-120]|uniref:Ig heavy chain variable region, VH3 family n=1 Tax=Listeria marthii FSL S4-120 TaxID=702457 RepID=A0ABP2JWI8_9LIST|nr:putative Ig heavy chain variable region, VH3 family [Listeria marthii FSL S4-120]
MPHVLCSLFFIGTEVRKDEDLEQYCWENLEYNNPVINWDFSYFGVSSGDDL